MVYLLLSLEISFIFILKNETWNKYIVYSMAAYFPCPESMQPCIMKNKGTYGWFFFQDSTPAPDTRGLGIFFFCPSLFLNFWS